MTDSAAEDIWFGHLVHRNRAENAGDDIHFFEPVHQGESVDHGCEHTHVIAGGPIDSAILSGKAAKNVSAADHDTDFDAEIVDFLDLITDRFEDFGIDRIAGVWIAQHLAAQF